ncbi:MAG: SAM-dependent methyltransferase [Phycisphaerales bacterium]|jgi:SAM-dependent methyltransferase
MQRFIPAALALMSSAVLAADGPVQFAKEAEALAPFATTQAARDWLDQAGRLPEIEPRTVYYSFRPKRGYTAEQYEALPEADREGLTEGDITTDETYYDTFYGTPTAYVRALDLAAAQLQKGTDTPFTWEGVKVLDYGYGQLGQLRMLAQCGAHATGIDVDPILEAIYSQPSDQGEAARTDDAGGEPGSVTLLSGYWPNEDEMVEEVGGGYDLIVSRNFLKRGYIAPTNGSQAWVDLGRTTKETLGVFYEALAPGGVFVIYSLGGPQPAEGYSPSGDVACPWSVAELEAAGFEVVEHDVDENGQGRDMARALGWDQPPRSMDLETSLFGSYTILRRPAE